MVDRGRSRVVGRSRLVDGGRLVGWSRFVDRGGVVGGRGSLVDRLMGGISGLALILHVHDIARVGISSVVGDNLGAAIREEDAVLAIGGVAITGLVGTKLNIVVVAILGIHAVLVLILGGSLLVCRLVVGRSGLVDGGWGIRGRGVGGHGRGRGGKGKEGNASLKQMIVHHETVDIEIQV